jgi:putative addiction module component (TIGR02574 family)
MADILQLPVEERIELVQDIWDSIHEAPDVVALTEEQRHELDRRLEEHRENPDDVISWEEIRSQFIK